MSRGQTGLSLGQSGVVPGTNPGFLLIYTREAQFVPVHKPSLSLGIPGTKSGIKSLCVKSLCAFSAPWSVPAALLCHPLQNMQKAVQDI